MTPRSTSSDSAMLLQDGSCPDDDALARYVDGLLAPREWSAVEAHVLRCSSCACLVGDPREHASADLLRSRLVVASVLSVETPLPERLGRYRVARVLGAGAMGTVFLARDPELDREVAIKCMRISSSADVLRYQDRLKSEAQLLARRGDPRVVEVYDVGEQDGVLYIVMEYVRGKTLRRWRDGVGSKEIIAAMTAAAQVLARLHRDGLVHGDFKPDNVLVEDAGRVRILDFGLARLLAPEASTQSTESKTESHEGPGPGTPAYMAPEQLRGGAPTAAGDQYAWCVSLFELLTTERPYDATSVDALVEQAERRTIAWRGVSRRVRSVIARGLDPKPARRFDSLDDAARALRWRRGVWLGGVVGTVAVVGGVALRPDASTPVAELCAVEGDALATWSPEATTRLDARFAELGIESLDGAEVAARLDEYAHRWRQHAELACVQGEDQPQALQACMSSAAAAYGQIVELLGEGREQTVRRAASVLGRLPSPEACFRSPASGTERGPVADDLRARLARVQTLRVVTQVRDAHVLALEAFELAAAHELPRLQARAALEVAMSVPQSAEVGPEQWLERAHDLAVGSGDDLTATGAALSLISQHVRRRDFEAARRWVRHAEGYLARTNQARQRATLNARIAHLHRMEGDLELALDYAQKAFDTYADFDGPHSLEAAKSRVSLGYTLLAAGRYEDAKLPLETAIADVVALHGETHAVVANACNGRAGVSNFLGEHETAVEYYRRAIAIQGELSGKGSLRVALLESNLGGALTDVGDHAAAVAVLRHAETAMVDKFGADDMRLIDVWLNLGRAMSFAADHAAALETLWRAATLYESRGQAGNPQHGRVEISLAAAYERSGRLAEAAEHYERALDLFRARLGNDHPDTKDAAEGLERVRKH